MNHKDRLLAVPNVRHAPISQCVECGADIIKIRDDGRCLLCVKKAEKLRQSVYNSAKELFK